MIFWFILVDILGDSLVFCDSLVLLGVVIHCYLMTLGDSLVFLGDILGDSLVLLGDIIGDSLVFFGDAHCTVMQ